MLAIQPMLLPILAMLNNYIHLILQAVMMIMHLSRTSLKWISMNGMRIPEQHLI